MASNVDIDDLNERLSKCSFMLSNKKQKICAFEGFTYKRDYPKGEISNDFLGSISWRCNEKILIYKIIFT